jgi:hypothetical protein
MAFTAKVKVGYVAPNGADAQYVQMYPNYGSNGKEINQEWASASPGLNFAITIRNEVVEKIGIATGKEYTATFEEDIAAE